MSERVIIPYRSSAMVRLLHPIDRDAVPNNPLDNTNDGSTCSYKVYDPEKDEAISVAEALGQTVLSITNAAKFDIGDQAEVEQDNGTFHASNITAVTPDDGTITLAVGLTASAAVGKRVRCRFGSSVSMSEFGTPRLDTRDWGFKAALSSTHACQIQDQEIDIEMAFIGSGGGGKDKQETILAQIKDVRSDE